MIQWDWFGLSQNCKKKKRDELETHQQPHKKRYKNNKTFVNANIIAVAETKREPERERMGT